METTPTQIAKCYEDIYKNHDERKLPFSMFVNFIELEKTTEEELSDIEYMCVRVDIWMDNLGMPSSYNQTSWEEYDHE